MYSKYTITYQGNQVVLYVKNELKASYDKIPAIFTHAKLMMADYVVDVKTNKVIKENKND